MLIKTIFDYQRKDIWNYKIINIYPQVLINAKVDSNKNMILIKCKVVDAVVNEVWWEMVEFWLGPSGSEPLVRVIGWRRKSVYYQKAREVINWWKKLK